MYEAGISKSFKAWHVMPGMAGPEGKLHQHDYTMEVTAARRSLDGSGMVCDLDVLDAAVHETVAQIDDRDLDAIRPSDAEAVTVEVLARWAHEEIASRIRHTGVDRLAIKVWESPTAFGGYAAALDDSSS